MTTEPTGLLAAQRAVLTSSLTSHEKLVVFALLNFWSTNSRSPWPSVETLVSLTSLARRTVIRTLQALEAAAVISVTRKSGRSNVFTLDAVFSGRLPMGDQCHRGTSATEAPVPTGHGDQCQPDTGPVPQRHPTSATVTPEETQEEIQVSDPPEESQRARKARAPKPKGTKAVEVPLSEDWEPTETHRAFASEHEHDIDLALEVVKFRGNAESRGRTTKSWNGAFTTWLANAVTFARRDGRTPVTAKRGPAPVSSAEDFERDAREGAAGW